MKKRQGLLACVLALCMLFTACTQKQEEAKQEEAKREESPQENKTQQPTKNENGKEKRILIAYFSMPEPSGDSAVAGASRVVEAGDVLGNTQFVAQKIGEETGGELFQIETVQSYPSDHDELTEYADNEKRQNARPELKTHIADMEQYDIIYIGYPNWWGDMPMPVYSFLEEYQMDGKIIVPFSTHGGSGFSATISTISGLQPNATVIDSALTISRNSVSDAQQEIKNWVKELNLQ